MPFVFTSNGDGFMFHGRTGLSDLVERFRSLDEFPSPSPSALWSCCRA